MRTSKSPTNNLSGLLNSKHLEKRIKGVGPMADRREDREEQEQGGGNRRRAPSQLPGLLNSSFLERSLRRLEA